MNQIKIGIVGTSFGAEFISLFRAHPNVRAVCIADLMPERLQYAQDMHGALVTREIGDASAARGQACLFSRADGDYVRRN